MDGLDLVSLDPLDLEGVVHDCLEHLERPVTTWFRWGLLDRSDISHLVLDGKFGSFGIFGFGTKFPSGL
ncbi:MAG: hypothetical protein ACLVJN_08000 [Streptococcus parasanguinis]